MNCIIIICSYIQNAKIPAKNNKKKVFPSYSEILMARNSIDDRQFGWSVKQ